MFTPHPQPYTLNLWDFGSTVFVALGLKGGGKRERDKRIRALRHPRAHTLGYIGGGDQGGSRGVPERSQAPPCKRGGSGLWDPATGIRDQGSGIWYQVSGIRYPVSGFRFPVSGFRASRGAPERSQAPPCRRGGSAESSSPEPRSPSASAHTWVSVSVKTRPSTQFWVQKRPSTHSCRSPRRPLLL